MIAVAARDIHCSVNVTQQRLRYLLPTQFQYCRQTLFLSKMDWVLPGQKRPKTGFSRRGLVLFVSSGTDSFINDFEKMITACVSFASCADPESFVRGGPTLTMFLVNKGRKDPNTTISGPSSARQRNAI